jgi:hypothetical protein
MTQGSNGNGGSGAGNRQQRRAAQSQAKTEGKLDVPSFLKVANKFVELANRENQTVTATELHMAFLWAAARYNAHVAKVVLDVQNHESFVADMTKNYQDMLRQHLADPTLDAPTRA